MIVKGGFVHVAFALIKRITIIKLRLKDFLKKIQPIITVIPMM